MPVMLYVAVGWFGCALGCALACAQTSTNAQGKPAATRPTPAAPSSQAAPAVGTFTLRAVSSMGDFLGLAEATERYAAKNLRLHCLGGLSPACPCR